MSNFSNVTGLRYRVKLMLDRAQHGTEQPLSHYAFLTFTLPHRHVSFSPEDHNHISECATIDFAFKSPATRVGILVST
ncbi:hypothetical protein CGCTS75_v000865 [Colletotrichum tropicale]|nr:hypothetical protein CGCTS75_v000865 [Colletotrichum tropicale]